MGGATVRAMEKLTSVGGIRWALLKWTTVPEDVPPEKVLIHRLRVVQTPLFALYLHKHIRPDPGRDLHDHPASFFSVIFKGGYIERRMGASMPLKHFALSARWMKAEWPHTIQELLRVPTWSVLLMGRRRRMWGFHTDNGWVPYKEYSRLNG